MEKNKIDPNMGLAREMDGRSASIGRVVNERRRGKENHRGGAK